jgi:hypothetical protein
VQSKKLVITQIKDSVPKATISADLAKQKPIEAGAELG